MPRINGQLVVYVVVGAVLLLVGLNSIRDEKSESAGFVSGNSSADAKPAEGLSIAAGNRRLVVDVSGAVRRPGVYRFQQGARVIDAIERAGGATGTASLGHINRAAVLSDGQQVVVPEAAAGGGPGSVGTATLPDNPVSIGTATQADLEEIDGIGPVTAQKILEFRDSQGGISSIDDLDQISGIGPVTMDSLRAALMP